MAGFFGVLRSSELAVPPRLNRASPGSEKSLPPNYRKCGEQDSEMDKRQAKAEHKSLFRANGAVRMHVGWTSALTHEYVRRPGAESHFRGWATTL